MLTTSSYSLRGICYKTTCVSSLILNLFDDEINEPKKIQKKKRKKFQTILYLCPVFSLQSLHLDFPSELAEIFLCSIEKIFLFSISLALSLFYDMRRKIGKWICIFPFTLEAVCTERGWCDVNRSGWQKKNQEEEEEVYWTLQRMSWNRNKYSNSQFRSGWKFAFLSFF